MLCCVCVCVCVCVWVWVWVWVWVCGCVDVWVCGCVGVWVCFFLAGGGGVGLEATRAKPGVQRLPWVSLRNLEACVSHWKGNLKRRVTHVVALMHNPQECHEACGKLVTMCANTFSESKSSPPTRPRNSQHGLQ